MRKLSKISKQSAESVSKDLSEMQKSMKTILKIVNEAAEVSGNQTTTTKQIAFSVEEITVSSEKIVNSLKQLY